MKMGDLETPGCYVCEGETFVRFDDLPNEMNEARFSILECKACGHGTTQPVPVDLSQYYAAYYGERHGFLTRYRAARRFTRLGHKRFEVGYRPRLLDIGSGDGSFLRVAAARNWDAIGLERTGKVPISGNSPIFDSLDDIKEAYGLGSFDRITCWHTLEHFESPAEVLSDAHGLLSENGRLLIAVPNYRSHQARFFGRDWLHLDIPRHLHHFGHGSIERILKTTGFEVIRNWHHEFEYDVAGWSQSLLNSVFDTKNIFLHSLMGRSKEFGKLAILTHGAIGALVSSLAVPFVIFGILCRNSGTIVIEAKKLNE